MKTKIPGVTLVKAHSNKWAVYEYGDFRGFVRRTNRSLRGSDFVFYYQINGHQEWHGAYDTRADAVSAMMGVL